MRPSSALLQNKVIIQVLRNLIHSSFSPTNSLCSSIVTLLKFSAINLVIWHRGGSEYWVYKSWMVGKTYKENRKIKYLNFTILKKDTALTVFPTLMHSQLMLKYNPLYSIIKLWKLKNTSICDDAETMNILLFQKWILCYPDEFLAKRQTCLPFSLSSTSSFLSLVLLFLSCSHCKCMWNYWSVKNR